MKARIAVVVSGRDYRVRYFANKECEVAILRERPKGGPFDAIIYLEFNRGLGDGSRGNGKDSLKLGAHPVCSGAQGSKLKA